MDNWYDEQKKTLEKYFCDYDTAVFLREIGFDEPCFGSFYTDIDENKKCGTNKQYNGFSYIQINEVDYEPDFITNSDKIHYVSAPTWEQARSYLINKHNFISANGYGYDHVSNHKKAIDKYCFEICYDGQFMFESDYVYEHDELIKVVVLKMIEILKKKQNE